MAQTCAEEEEDPANSRCCAVEKNGTARSKDDKYPAARDDPFGTVRIPCKDDTYQRRWCESETGDGQQSDAGKRRREVFG